MIISDYQRLFAIISNYWQLSSIIAIFANCWQLMAIGNYCEFWRLLAMNYWLLLEIIGDYWQLLAIISDYCQLQSLLAFFPKSSPRSPRSATKAFYRSLDLLEIKKIMQF